MKFGLFTKLDIINKQTDISEGISGNFLIKRGKNKLTAIFNYKDNKIIINDGKQDLLFSQNYACTHCNLSYEVLQPAHFSFNSPFGACANCDGLGTKTELDIDKMIPDGKESLIEGAIRPIGPQPSGRGIGTIIKRLSTIYN